MLKLQNKELNSIPPENNSIEFSRLMSCCPYFLFLLPKINCADKMFGSQFASFFVCKWSAQLKLPILILSQGAFMEIWKIQTHDPLSRHHLNQKQAAPVY